MTAEVQSPQAQAEQKSKKKPHDIYVYLGRGRYEVALVGAPDYDSCFALAKGQVRNKYPEAKLKFIPSGIAPKRKTRR